MVLTQSLSLIHIFFALFIVFSFVQLENSQQPEKIYPVIKAPAQTATGVSRFQAVKQLFWLGIAFSLVLPQSRGQGYTAAVNIVSEPILATKSPLTWISPVSYTHLDVYKRQSQVWAICLAVPGGSRLASVRRS